MKVFIVLALVAVTQAAVLIGGTSEQYRSQDGAGNYAFGYNEGHGSGATFRKESGSHGVVAGSYGLSDADGRRRVVNYVADAAGFRADIQTNEPGVEPKDPANTAINKHAVAIAPVATAPVLQYAAAPHYAAPHYAAPHYGGLHYAGVPHHGGFAYNTAVGHHGLVAPHYGLGHHGLGHHGYYY